MLFIKKDTKIVQMSSITKVRAKHFANSDL